MAKNQCPVSFCFVFSEIFEKLAYKRLVDYLGKGVFYVISCMVSGLLVQL